MIFQFFQFELVYFVIVIIEIEEYLLRVKKYYDRNLGGKVQEEIQFGQWVYVKCNFKYKYFVRCYEFVKSVF